MDNKKLYFQILGIPQAKQSMRTYALKKGGKLKFNSNGSPILIKSKPKGVEEAENNYRAQIIKQLPDNFTCHDNAFKVNHITFVYPIRKSEPKSRKHLITNNLGIIYKTSKPDVDNLVKTVLDSMNGVVFTDDSRLVQLNNVRKIYGVNPQVNFEIEFLDNDIRGL